MARILRGEIRWADLNPVREHEQGGMCPVVIISQDIFNERSGTVIAMALTIQPQPTGFPLTLILESTNLSMQSWVKISQVRTLSVDKIGDVLDILPPEKMSQLIERLNEIAGR